MSERKNTEYLGDGLYAEYQGYSIRVYASDGIAATNEVFFERSELAALVRFAEKQWGDWGKP